MLIDKIASNQSWKGERQPARPRGVQQFDCVDMLAAKMDLLMKKLESPYQEVNLVMESRMTCETCGETGHSGTSCPLTQEDANFVGSKQSQLRISSSAGLELQAQPPLWSTTRYEFQ